MDFNDTKEEADFREEVKTWLKENASKGEFHAVNLKNAPSTCFFAFCKLEKASKTFFYFPYLKTLHA